MGTETINRSFGRINAPRAVKLNNPLMGTETIILFQWVTYKELEVLLN